MLQRAFTIRVLVSMFFVLTAGISAQAPGAVPVAKEPHHHLVLENSYVRVFRVSVPAHESTLLHQHDLPYLYIALGPADFVNAVAGKPEVRVTMKDGQVGYSPGHFAHVARVEADIPFNNVTIELLHPQGEPRNLCAQIAANAATGPCEINGSDRYLDVHNEPQLETEEMKLHLVRVEHKTDVTLAPMGAGGLIVVLNNSEIQANPEGKPKRILRGGDVRWLDSQERVTVSSEKDGAWGFLELLFRDKRKGAKP